MCSSDTAPTTVPSGCLFSIIIFPYLPANVIIIPVVWNSCSRGSVLDLSFRGCLRFELGLLHGRTIWIGPFKKAHLRGSIWKENQTQIDPRRKKDPSNISFILWWIKHLPCIICNCFCASLFTSLQIITTVCCECYRVNINSSETAIFDFYFSVLVVSTTSPLFILLQQRMCCYSNRLHLWCQYFESTSGKCVSKILQSIYISNNLWGI